MKRSQHRLAFVRSFCESPDLRTYDPYDIWKTPFGFRAKNFYNQHRVLGLPAATVLTVFDRYVNDRLRLFYVKQEYPIVRALAAQALLKLYSRHRDSTLLTSTVEHLEWLRRNSCVGFHGPCWGLGFHYAVDKGLIYDANTPLTTMTPYALEAFIEWMRVTDDESYLPIILGIFEFLEKDVPILEENDEYLVTSYSHLRDRTVINAVSYVMYSYALLLRFLDKKQREKASVKIRKLYNYIVLNQASDGSWMYSPQSDSFIDCFHSCIVIKNLIKTADIVDLVDCDTVARRGYKFLKDEMYIAEEGLFKRFAVSNKPGIVRYDLYDNAEILNLAHLIRDFRLVQVLESSIAKTFVSHNQVFSHVDWLGIRHGPNLRRWAVMPYVYALAALESCPEK
jgi:hypothetical protein